MLPEWFLGFLVAGVSVGRFRFAGLSLAGSAALACPLLLSIVEGAGGRLKRTSLLALRAVGGPLDPAARAPVKAASGGRPNNGPGLLGLLVFWFAGRSRVRFAHGHRLRCWPRSVGRSRVRFAHGHRLRCWPRSVGRSRVRFAHGHRLRCWPRSVGRSRVRFAHGHRLRCWPRSVGRSRVRFAHGHRLRCWPRSVGRSRVRFAHGHRLRCWSWSTESTLARRGVGRRGGGDVVTVPGRSGASRSPVRPLAGPPIADAREAVARPGDRRIDPVSGA